MNAANRGNGRFNTYRRPPNQNQHENASSHRQRSPTNRRGKTDNRKPRKVLMQVAEDDNKDSEEDGEFYAEEEDEASDYPEFKYGDDEGHEDE
jgi:hypothetical protein